MDHTMTNGQPPQPENQNTLTANPAMPLFRATGRTLRSTSVSTVTRLLEYNPSGGMWQATGTAIAHAPNVTDLRSPDEIFFDVHGRGIRRVSTQDKIGGTIIRRATAPTIDLGPLRDDQKLAGAVKSLPRLSFDHPKRNQAHNHPKASWADAFKKGSIAAGRFILTPTGVFIVVYGLNVIAWGAMLFFLLLDVGSMSKERKEVWIEIDSQILNGLFCLTSWGLAPWRIRDTYWLLMWHFGSAETSKESIMQLAKRNSSWFRICDPDSIGMATFMWVYNRHNRPAFGVGLFIGLGCFSSLLAGITSWWEGRKVKRIEGAFSETNAEEKQESIEP